MEHDKLKALILLLPDGELSAGEKESAEGHLKGCAQCSALAAGAGVSQRLFSKGTLPAGNEAFVGAVMDRITAEDAQGVELPVRWWAPALALGLACAVFIIAGVLPSPDGSVDALLVVNEDAVYLGGTDGVADFMGVSMGEG